ncbi:MAG: hypothetical protein IKI75_03745, partial [Lachnospiraceae bacterium]|nr:hypothetical protein [Lachnospiraceae bacterium]
MTKDEAMKPADGPGTVPERRQFHPAYEGATELELIENAADLVFERELALNELPRRIDLLVILKNDGTEIRSVLGRIFRRINVWEFKSPHDSLTVYDYHKTLSYVYQYLSEYGKGRAVSDCTISFLKEGKPRELMKELKLLGYTEKKIQPGLYWY